MGSSHPKYTPEKILDCPVLTVYLCLFADNVWRSKGWSTSVSDLRLRSMACQFQTHMFCLFPLLIVLVGERQVKTPPIWLLLFVKF